MTERALMELKQGFGEKGKYQSLLFDHLKCFDY